MTDPDTIHAYELAIALDEAEHRAHVLRGRLESVVEALVWCAARIDQLPAWVRCTIDEAEAPL